MIFVRKIDIINWKELANEINNKKRAEEEHNES